MMKCNDEYALKTAVELAKINLESTDSWVYPESVTNFIEEVYSFLVAEEKDATE